MDNNYQNQFINTNTAGEAGSCNPYHTANGSGAGTDNTAGNTSYNAYYQQNPYPGNAYNPYQQPEGGAQKARPPKKRKSGFGAMLGKCAAIAVVFGLVAGGVFTGVSYAGTKALGITSSSADAESPADDKPSASVQKTSTGTAKDLSDVSAIAQEAMPSIVAITNMATVSYQTFWGVEQKESESCGSGVIIDQDDKYLYIATNNHVVADAEELTIQFSDDTTVTGEVRGTDPSNDLAVVMVKLSDIETDTLNTIKVATVAEDEELVVGQGVIAIGNALGYGQSVTNGIISALERTITIQDYTTGETTIINNMIQTNAAINPGNSGGALLNADGELIGINSAKYSDTDVEGFGYAIPMSDAKSIIEELISKGEVEQAQSAYLGIQGQDISSSIAQAYNMPEGVYVYQVVSGSPADKAGLRQGDIITGFEGQEISSMSELKQLLASYEAGQEITLTIQRLGNGYQEQSIDITLGTQSDTNK